MIEPRTASVCAGMLRLNVTLWGDPAAPPVLLLHGLRDHSRSWDWTANALADRYFLIAPDLRGHGDSDWTELEGYALSSYVLDLADIAAAFGLERYAIVGHSLGGALGLRLAAAFPDKVAAVSGVECIEMPLVREERAKPVPYPARLRQWIDQRQANRARTRSGYATLAEARARMLREQQLLDAETIDHLLAHAMRRDGTGAWHWKFDPGTLPRPPFDQFGREQDQILEAVECPVLLQYGDAGWVPMPPPERMARLRNHRVIPFPGGTHWLHHEQRGKFIRCVSDFLDLEYRNPPNA